MEDSLQHILDMLAGEKHLLRTIEILDNHRDILRLGLKYQHGWWHRQRVEEANDIVAAQYMSCLRVWT